MPCHPSGTRRSTYGADCEFVNLPYALFVGSKLLFLKWASAHAKKAENIYGQKLRVTYVSSTRVHFLAHVSDSGLAIL